MVVGLRGGEHAGVIEAGGFNSEVGHSVLRST